jgi:hypothetical protein
VILPDEKPADIFAALPLLRYRFECELKSPLRINPNFGAALRGAMGRVLKTLAVGDLRHHLSEKAARNQNPYSWIFESEPPPGSPVLSKASNIPRPYILRPPSGEQLLGAQDSLIFELILIGKATDYFPWLFFTFWELGKQGLGYNETRYALKTVSVLDRTGKVLNELYDGKGFHESTVTSAPTERSLQERIEKLPTDQITIRFLTPVALRSGSTPGKPGRPVGLPDFGIFFRRLRDRISSLIKFYGQPEAMPEINWKGLGEAATSVHLVENQTKWVNMSRTTRRGELQDLGGLVGTARYAGDLRPFLLWLVLGEQIHVGRNTVVGNGRYELQP